MKTITNSFTVNKQQATDSYIHPIVKHGKRVFDVLFSIAAMLSLLPVLPFIALAIKLDTQGPVFYLQQRLGQSHNGKNRVFNIVKFRTMGTDAG